VTQQERFAPISRNSGEAVLSVVDNPLLGASGILWNLLRRRNANPNKASRTPNGTEPCRPDPRHFRQEETKVRISHRRRTGHLKM